MSEHRPMRKIEDIEQSLQLCRDMDSPAIVIPSSMVEKHFPAKRLPGYPNTPAYDLEDMQEWAKAKGWAVAFATTGSKDGKRILPGIRFTPSSKNKAFENQKEKPSPDHWYKKPPAVIGLAVASGLILLGIRYFLSHGLGVHL